MDTINLNNKDGTNTNSIVKNGRRIRTLHLDMKALKDGDTAALIDMKSPDILITHKVSSIPVPIQSTDMSEKIEQHKNTVHTAHIVSPIKTYEGDYQQKVEDTGSSMATVLAAQQDAATGAPHLDISQESSQISSPTPLSSILYSIIGVLLLVGGSAGAYFAYSKYIIKNKPIVLAPVVTTPIFVDEREKIADETPEGILQSIIKSLSRPLAQNTVRLMYTDSAKAIDNSIFSALQFPAPSGLLRNINASFSMAGIVSVEDEQTPFFILSVTSYRDTFSKMLVWEATMVRDMNALFSFSSSQSFSQNLSNSNNIDIVSPISVVFRDEVVSNIDVRVYRDASGKSMLIYGYWNQSTLIIARNHAAFIEIVGRLATSRALR